MPDGRPECGVLRLGLVEYRAAWEVQRRLIRERSDGRIPDTLVLLEHPPVYTSGRRDPSPNLLSPVEMLGAPLVESDRGGDITFHGPGQLVAYPIIDLRAAGVGVAGYVRALEDVIGRVLSTYGIPWKREAGLTGVWVGSAKIAAIGVRVSRPEGVSGSWVTSHGLALNVAVDLRWFDRIVPCGIRGRAATSMAAFLTAVPNVEEVGSRLADQFGEVFGRRISVVPAASWMVHAPLQHQVQ